MLCPYEDNEVCVVIEVRRWLLVMEPSANQQERTTIDKPGTYRINGLWNIESQLLTVLFICVFIAVQENLFAQRVNLFLDDEFQHWSRTPRLSPRAAEALCWRGGPLLCSGPGWGPTHLTLSSDCRSAATVEKRVKNQTHFTRCCFQQGPVDQTANRYKF